MKQTFQRVSRRTATYVDKYPLVGPACWWVTIQYVATQIVVARAWTQPAYSWPANAISDLGNTACGLYSGRMVCSPRHDLMNASFIVLGATMVAGSSLIYHEFTKTHGSRVGFAAMALAGFGTALVGIFPENEAPPLHAFGALLAFLIGNIALVVFGISLRLSKPMRTYTLLSGIVALTAFGLYATRNYLGLGLGGMERLTGYPQTLWLIVFGVYMTKNHFRMKRTQSE